MMPKLGNQHLPDLAHKTKKMSKELHHSNNPPELQKMVDDGKRAEWETILSKQDAVRVHYGRKAAQIKRDDPDRFIGSRFALTRKPLEEGADALLFASSPYQYRKRWDAILRCLDLPKSVRLTPGGLRGGFAVWAYRVGRPVQDIMWSLRLRSQTTLESYLQETAALNCFAGLPFNVRKDIMLVSEMFTYLPAAAL
jgi:hypothetical protein